MKKAFLKLLLPFCFLFFSVAFIGCETSEGNNQTHEHVFTNYVSDGNATYTADGTKTATCDYEGCSFTNTITDVGSMLKNVLLFQKNEVIGVTEEGKNAKSINIPSTYNGYTITSISDEAFSDCASLETVSIPSSITNIDDGTFSPCKNITSITVSEDNEKYKSIDGNLYNLYNKNISTLIKYASGKTETSFTVPDGVKYIESNAFSYSVHLKSVSLPSSVSLIQPFPFAGCKNLLSINVSDANNRYTSVDGNLYNKDVSELVQYAIGKTETSFTVPTSVERILMGAFMDSTNLSNITLPNALTEIKEFAFAGCTSLTDITIPDSITSLGRSIFVCCTNLTSVRISKSVNSINCFAFDDCISLSNIIVDEANANYKTINGSLYSKNGSKLIKYALGKSDSSFNIPNTVTSIGEYAFEDCTNLTNVNIPDSVTSIDQGAFYNCTSLKSVDIPNSVTSLGPYAFSDCTSLTNVTIGKGITHLPEGLFINCVSLKSVQIPPVKTIGDGMRPPFRNCTSLTSIIFDGTKEQWKKTPKAPNWNKDSSINKIICTDGEVLL